MSSIKIILLFLFFPFVAFTQRTETALDFSTKNSRLVLEVENDMLFSTDSYYTAGIGLAYTHKNLRKTLAQLIIKPKSQKVLTFTGFGLEQRIFTPYSITQPDKIENDQPYSAYLLATNYTVIVNPEKNLKLSNELGIGIMGPAAGGEQAQTLVHKIVNSPIPLGWENQLQNTFLIDYRFRIEKGFGGDWLANHLIPFWGARVGTLTNRVQIGAMLKLGNKQKFLRYDQNLDKLQHKFIWEWTFVANLQGVFYDATLQGSMFKDDPNALDNSEKISHQYQFRTGVNLYYYNFTLRYMLNFNSASFDSAVYHRFGSINIGFSF